MRSHSNRDRPRREGRGRYFVRRRVCAFCADKSLVITFKQPIALRRFLTDRYKVTSRRRTGTCAKHQRMVAQELKRARFLGLLPLAPGHIHVTGWIN